MDKTPLLSKVKTRALMVVGAALTLAPGCRSDPAVDHPCGPSSAGPCMLLLESRQHYGGPHTSWFFIDTAGKQYKYESPNPDRNMVTKAMEDWHITIQEMAGILRTARPQGDRVPMRDVRRVLRLVAQAKDAHVEELGGPCEGWLRDLHGFVFDSRAQAQESVHLQESGCGILFEQNTSPAAIEVSQWADDLWQHGDHPRRPH
jgi:hypothetical protein